MYSLKVNARKTQQGKTLSPKARAILKVNTKKINQGPS